MSADANVHGAAILSYEKEVDLISETLAPIVIGPLVVVPVADVTAKLEGGASGRFSSGINGRAVFETSVTVSTNQSQPQFEDLALREIGFSPNDTRVTLHADAKIGVGSRLNLLLFGVTGPYATARACARIAANVLASPCWTLYSGIDAELGVRVTTPAIPVLGQLVLVDVRTPALSALDLEVASGDCKAPPDESTLPPGSGPDAIRFANPTYTPWSRTFASPIDDIFAGRFSGGYVDLQRTLDGHYVPSGRASNAVVKLDENGALVWARELRTDTDYVLPRRVPSSDDAELLVVSRIPTAPILLTRLAQDGSVTDARAYDVAGSSCGVNPVGLVSDGAGGAWVAGSCDGGEAQAFLLHAGRDGTSLWTLHSEFLRIDLVERIGSDAFVAGRERRAGRIRRCGPRAMGDAGCPPALWSGRRALERRRRRRGNRAARAPPLGALWAFKPFARDGFLDFLAGTASADPLGIASLDCSMTASDANVEVVPVSVAVKSVALTSTPRTLDVAAQTAT
ncbi:MAG TPA: hypothetical protein VNO26_16395 [Candidatus Limnocylindria bacterium]|nr:hypothetical protein [Candidatus Limnocylindria bacterium]